MAKKRPPLVAEPLLALPELQLPPPDALCHGRDPAEQPFCSHCARLQHARDTIAQLIAACERMDALMDMLWKAVPWGKTSNLDAALLNEAPGECKRAIAKARGQR